MLMYVLIIIIHRLLMLMYVLLIECMIFIFQFEVSTEEKEYTLDGTKQDMKIKIKQASINSYVVLQMVDHAVLLLNDRTNLTPERVIIYYNFILSHKIGNFCCSWDLNSETKLEWGRGRDLETRVLWVVKDGLKEGLKN